MEKSAPKINGWTVREALHAINARNGTPVPYAERLVHRNLSMRYTPPERRKIVRYARRVLALLEAARGLQHAAGMGWYAVAKRAAHAAVPSVSDAWSVAQALAAVSPGMPWGRNTDALQAAHAAANGAPLAQAIANAGLPVPYGYAPYKRAVQALQGLDVLKGRKVQAFARGIATAGQTDAVCVDGHATLAARAGLVTRRPGITKAPALTARQYDLLAAAYATAAHVHGCTPAQAQAIAWVVWRNIPVEA